MMNLFLTNMQLLTSQDINWWTVWGIFISCLDAHSDGTHSLQRIHWWANDVMLKFSKSVPMNKHFKQIFIFGWTHGVTKLSTEMAPNELVNKPLVSTLYVKLSKNHSSKRLMQPYPEWSLQHLFQMKLSVWRVHAGESSALTTIALGECINAFSSLRSFSACVPQRNKSVSSAFSSSIFLGGGKYHNQPYRVN